jgi:hypothetical protein
MNNGRYYLTPKHLLNRLLYYRKEYNSKQEGAPIIRIVPSNLTYGTKTALVKRIVEENRQLIKELEDIKLQNYSLKLTLTALKRENEEYSSLTQELRQRVEKGKGSFKAEACTIRGSITK